ncbi:hypothetical protein Dimus_011322 [Dionaea muscipula]
MEPEVDHYRVLGLASGEEGAKFSIDDIKKAYKLKALELHPDKRPDDPNARKNFQKLRSSFDILKDEKARKLFDDLLQVKREYQLRQAHREVKRQRMVSDLEKREKEAFTPDLGVMAWEKEKKIMKKLQEEIAMIKALHAHKRDTPAKLQETRGMSTGRGSESGLGLDKERVLKVTWDMVGGEYGANRLKELFQKFGEVEDIVIRRTKKKRSALVVMTSKEAAIAATRSVSGDLSNPLLVLPLKPTVEANDLASATYQTFENSVLGRLAKATGTEKGLAHKRVRHELESSHNSNAAASEIPTNGTLNETCSFPRWGWNTNFSRPLLELPLLDSVGPKEMPSSQAPINIIDINVPPSHLKLFEDLRNEIYRISIEKESLKIEVMSARTMINILQSKIEHLSKENDNLKRITRDI